jgi:hypothetical protein
MNIKIEIIFIVLDNIESTISLLVCFDLEQGCPEGLTSNTRKFYIFWFKILKESIKKIFVLPQSLRPRGISDLENETNIIVLFLKDFMLLTN